MVARKTAVTIPEEVLDAVDRAAEERGESRSAFISRVLKEALRARRDAEITRRLDRLFASEDAESEQSRMVDDLDGAGHDWADERW